MKILILLILLPFMSNAQEIDGYTPYMVSKKGEILGANTLRLNKSKGETDVDTINLKLLVTDPRAGLYIIGKESKIRYDPVFKIEAYSIWITDSTLGGHWDIFDMSDSLVRNTPAEIWRIIEVPPPAPATKPKY